MGAKYNGREGGGRDAAGASRPARLRARLAGGPILLLDGAMGTELERRGVPSALPLWSAWALLSAPERVAEVHREYVEAGVDLLTANTFRTQRRSLARADLGHRAAELTRLAVSLALRHARGGDLFVLGSSAPLEDCFRPDLVPGDAELEREHAEHAGNLVAAGADGILVETMNTSREAVAAGRAARATGLPWLVCFAARGDGTLLSGEPLRDALRAVASLAPDAVGVNCLPPSAVAACLPALRATGLPFAIHPNLGAPLDPEGRTRSEDCSPAAFAARLLVWRAAGARVLGGCCGTQPAHLHAAARSLRRSVA
jgi:S-methylmethionine-dependent homocysteine/selenocysteine methylase